MYYLLFYVLFQTSNAIYSNFNYLNPSFYKIAFKNFIRLLDINGCSLIFRIEHSGVPVILLYCTVNTGYDIKPKL